jgi:hypothetical protein
MHRKLGRLLCAAAVLSAGCAETGGGGNATITDSAGVRIVANSAPAWSPGEEWRVAGAPSVSIGDSSRSPAEEFTAIRRVLSLPDGRIIVANGNAPPELRVFDADGAHVTTIGRQGAGPGEFRAIWDVWLAAPDTLVVFDPAVSRVSYFAPDGTLLHSTDMRQITSPDAAAPAAIPAVPWARFPDGTFLMRPNRWLPESSQGSGRATVTIVRARDDGSTMDTIGVFPEADYITTERGPAAPRFGRLAVIHVSGSSIFRGMGDDFTIDEYDVEGRHLRSIRRPHTPRPVTDELVERMRQHELATAPPARRDYLMRDYSERPRLPTLAAFGSTWIVDAVRNLWVQHDAIALDSTGEWTVFDADGRWLGTVRIPPRLRPFEIGRDYILGVWRDELDVQSVRRYPLLKEHADR